MNDQKPDKSTRLFRAGLPYAPDVKRLEDAFPSCALAEGIFISHSELENVVHAPQGSGRYYSVVNSWIAQQRNGNGIFIVWIQGQGVKVLNPAEVLRHGERRVIEKSRQTCRAVSIFRWVDRDRLDDIGKKRLDHQAIVGFRISEALKSARKELAVDLSPVKSLPKPKPNEAE